jgi:hypothetical protein
MTGGGCADDASDKSRTDDPVNGLSLRFCMYESSSEEVAIFLVSDL